MAYGFKINDKDSISVIQGEDLEINIRVFDKDTLYPFQSLNHTFLLRIKAADGTVLELPGTNVNNYIGHARFTLSAVQVETLPVGKNQSFELTITATQTGKIQIVQIPKVLEVLQRLF